MSDLIVIAYPSEQRAEEMRNKLFDLQKQYLIEIEDAVIAERLPNGKVKLHQEFSTTGFGAVSGGFWGMLIGLIFFMPIAGTLIGAGIGALTGALSDYGIDNKSMQQMAEALTPGSAELFVLVRKATTDKVLEALQGTGGTVIKTSLDHTQEDALRNAIGKAMSSPAR